MRFLIATLLCLALVSAQDFYADVIIDVQEDGSAVMSGTTDHPLLQGSTQEFTSKKQAYWLFNLTIPDEFETYIIEVRLPSGAVLNYAQGKSVRIESANNRVVIKQIGAGDISLVAQYQLQKQKQALDWLVTGLSILATLVGFWLVMMLAYKRGNKKAREVKMLPEYVDGLPARQKEILRLVQKAGGKLTQKQIEEKMSIPKSSVSRNIDSLVRKGLLEKQSLGLSNIVKLK